MKANRIFAIASLAILSVMSMSCERIQDVGKEPSRDCEMLLFVKNEAPQTKSVAEAGVSYVSLFNEDGTENKDFVLECVTVPTGGDMCSADTRAALYGSGIKHGAGGGEEPGDYTYCVYQAPIVLTGKCNDNTIYNEELVAYDKELGLWIPSGGRIWEDEEKYEFRAHLPETLNGVTELEFGSDISFVYSIPESSAEQQDIMFGYFPNGDASREDKGYKIADIPFKHALASVRFMVYLPEGGNSGSTPSMAIEKVSMVDVFKMGRCTQEGGQDFKWSALTEGGYDPEEYGEAPAKTTIYGESDYAFDLTPGQYTALGYDDEEDGNDYVFTVMPQALKDHPVNLVLECISSGDPLTFKATVSSGEWKSGYTTIYRLMPNIECGTVDLGLSVIWGDKNLGAFRYLESGFKFLWGETSPYEADRPYKYYDNPWDKNITKYNENDGLKVLQKEDDPATHFLGEPWRTPTIEECMELDIAEWIDKYATSFDLHNMFVSKFDVPYKDRKIMWPSSDGNARDIISSSLSSNVSEYLYLYGWISQTSYEPGYISETWDGKKYNYTYLGTLEADTFDRGQSALPVRPVIPVLIFDDFKTQRPNNIIAASDGSSVSFTLAEEYKAQSWTAEADGVSFDSGEGSGSVTIPSGAKKVVIKRDTGVVIGTINVN